jgi:hypothetical protein
MMMTRREGLFLASRAFALYLLCWGLSDVTYLPQVLLSVKHHSSVLLSEDYWSRYYLADLAFHILRIVALFTTAGWLYRCGPRVESYFFPPEKVPQAGPAENA